MPSETEVAQAARLGRSRDECCRDLHARLIRPCVSKGARASDASCKNPLGECAADPRYMKGKARNQWVSRFVPSFGPTGQSDGDWPKDDLDRTLRARIMLYFE